MSEEQLSIKIVADASSLQSSLDSIKTELGGIKKSFEDTFNNVGKNLTDAGKTLTTKVSAPIVAASGIAFKFAADFQDAMGATDQIFKGSGQQVKDWAGTLESYYGIAEKDALDYVNIMGSMLKNIGGLTEAEAAAMGGTLVELAGDLSAMFGGTTESAVQAITGALKGNNSMLDNYGMGVNEATIKTKAMEMGLYDGTGAMDLQTKQAATLALIMEQTADAQGQAARESEGASGSMKAMTTEIQNLATNLGGVLLPIITPIISKITEWVQKFKEMSPATQEMIVKIALLVAAIGPLLMFLGSVSSGIGSIIGLGTKLATNWGTISKVGTALSSGLTKGIGLIFSPTGLIVLGIAAVIAIGVLLYKNWDTIKEHAQKLWDKMKQIFTTMKETVVKLFTDMGDHMTKTIEKAKEIVSNVLEALKKIFETIFEAIKKVVVTIFDFIKDTIKDRIELATQIVTTTLNILKTVFTTIFDAIKTVVLTVFNFIKDTIQNRIELAKNIISTTLDLIKAIFSGRFGEAKDIVINVFDSIKNAISDKINAAKDAVGTAIEKIKNFFNFEWSLPKLKVPSFDISGKFSLNPPSVPKFRINWNARGGIFKKPTLLGNGQGVGDASNGRGSSPEVVAPLSDLKQMLGLDDGSKGNTIINLNGNYGFRDKDDMDYFMNELALAGRRA